jgi:hypothetical protein
MDPELLRAGLRLGVLIALLAAVTLPFQDPAAAAFVVDVLALAIAVLFIAGVALVARLAGSAMPASAAPRDSANRDRYNVRDQSATRTGANVPGGKEE